MAGREHCSLARVVARATSPSMGKTYLTNSMEWTALILHSIQATVIGPQIAVGVVTSGSPILRQFVQSASWLTLVRADVEQGAAMYMFMYYTTIAYLAAIGLIWVLIVLFQPKSR